MLIRKPADISSSEITSEADYLGRREFMRRAAALAASVSLASCGSGSGRGADSANGDVAGAPQADTTNTFEEITSYNNYYEFGTDKTDPMENAGAFRTKPWSVAVEGLVKKPGTLSLEDFLKPHALQERTYRMRCVEGWFMVIPWNGIALADVIRRLEPLPSAKYVQMTTLMDAQQMPGQRRALLPWPYTEALRMDEATHPLTLLATGIYGKPLPNQNGAPLRLVVPWKYGFKGVKAIVKIAFTEQQPRTTWNIANADEYGFFANVNPTVDHPRWTQSRERRIGEFRRRPTLMFNGYAEQVQSMYSGMDLRRNY